VGCGLASAEGVPGRMMRCGVSDAGCHREHKSRRLISAKLKQRVGYVLLDGMVETRSRCPNAVVRRTVRAPRVKARTREHEFM
jgi:hypothetical protein